MKSRFVNDVKQEHILTPILVDIVSEFLNIYNMSANLISFEDDADAQYQGIDFVMSNSDNSSNLVGSLRTTILPIIIFLLGLKKQI